MNELGFASRILGETVTRTHALEELVIASFLRGLSTRDVEALLEESFGEAVVSKSSVSRICEQTRERYRAWCGRRSDEHGLAVSCRGRARRSVRRDRRCGAEPPQ